MKERKVSETCDLPYNFGTECTSYLVFSFIFIPIVFLYCFITFRSPNGGSLQGLMAISSIYFGFVLWLNSFKVNLYEDRLIYSSLLSRNNTVFFDDITKVGIQIWLQEDSFRKSAFYRLNIYDSNAFNKNPLTINLKPFSKRDLTILVRTILLKNPVVARDERVTNLANGSIDSIVSGGIENIVKGIPYLLLIFVLAAVIKVIIYAL